MLFVRRGWGKWREELPSRATLARKAKLTTIATPKKNYDESLIPLAIVELSREGQSEFSDNIELLLQDKNNINFFATQDSHPMELTRAAKTLLLYSLT